MAIYWAHFAARDRQLEAVYKSAAQQVCAAPWVAVAFAILHVADLHSILAAFSPLGELCRAARWATIGKSDGLRTHWQRLGDQLRGDDAALAVWGARRFRHAWQGHSSLTARLRNESSETAETLVASGSGALPLREIQREKEREIAQAIRQPRRARIRQLTHVLPKRCTRWHDDPSSFVSSVCWAAKNHPFRHYGSRLAHRLVRLAHPRALRFRSAPVLSVRRGGRRVAETLHAMPGRPRFRRATLGHRRLAR